MMLLVLCDLGGENLGPWKNEVTQLALAPVPESSSDLAEDHTLILAANRTKRPDILRGFRGYRDGWDIANKHYWAVSCRSHTIVYVIKMDALLLFMP